MAGLFDPLSLRDIRLKNRIMISPMSSYHGAPDGFATDWHFVHYGRWALGGAGLVTVEATAVSREGRVTYGCPGLWDDAQIEPMARIAAFLKRQDSVPAIQLNHSGRKGSFRRPWHGYLPLDEEDTHLRGEAPWPLAGPSDLPLNADLPAPRQMSVEDIRSDVEKWREAARRAHEAGFDVLELHAAHGYQINQFLSPVANTRNDVYGGDLAGRMRFAREVVAAVRAVWPERKPLFMRLSCVDGVEGGWDMDDTIALARKLKSEGVDVIDCSSGGIGGAATNARVPRGPGYQVPFADAVRRAAGMPTVAVGLITDPRQADTIIGAGQADIVAIGREALVDPNWPNRARTALFPERGYADWPQETGWWLDMRTKSLRAR